MNAALTRPGVTRSRGKVPAGATSGAKHPVKASTRDARGYGGRTFQAASYFAARHVSRGRSDRSEAEWTGKDRPPALHGALAFLSFLARAPRVRLRLSDSSEGREIGAYLHARSLGLRWNQIAQGVLELPEDGEQYFRGKSRQAVRTNLRRAAEMGVRCESVFDPGGLRTHVPLQEGEPAADGTPRPKQPQWIIYDAEGNTIGCMAATIDEECAMLHYLSGDTCEARYLLHSELVRHLCRRRVRHLIVVGASGLALAPGIQYFQHVLGYTVAHLRVEQARPARGERHALAALAPLAG